MAKTIRELLSLFESAYTSVHDAIARDRNEIVHPENITNYVFVSSNGTSIDFSTVMNIFKALETKTSLKHFVPTQNDIDAINALCSNISNGNQDAKNKLEANFDAGVDGQRELCIELAKTLLGDDGTPLFQGGVLNNAKKFGKNENYIDLIHGGETIFDSFNAFVYTQCMMLKMMKNKTDSLGKTSHEEVDGGDDVRIQKIANEYMVRYNTVIENYITKFISDMRSVSTAKAGRVLDALNDSTLLPRAALLNFILSEYQLCYDKSPEDISRIIGRDILENHIESQNQPKHAYDVNTNAASTSNTDEEIREYMITPDNMEGAVNCYVYPRTMTDVIRIPGTDKSGNALREAVRSALEKNGELKDFADVFCDKVLSTKENNKNDFIKFMTVGTFKKIINFLAHARDNEFMFSYKYDLFHKNGDGALSIVIDDVLSGRLNVNSSGHRKFFVVGPSSKEGSAMERVQKYNPYKYGNNSLRPMPTNIVNNQAKNYAIAYPGSTTVSGEGLTIKLISGQKISVNEDDIKNVGNSVRSKMSNIEFAYPFHRENSGEHWICLLQDGIAFAQMTDSEGNAIYMTDSASKTELPFGSGKSEFAATDAGKYMNAVYDSKIPGKFAFRDKKAQLVYIAAARLLYLYKKSDSTEFDINSVKTLNDIFTANIPDSIEKDAILKRYDNAIKVYNDGKVDFSHALVQMYNPENGKVELKLPASFKYDPTVDEDLINPVSEITETDIVNALVDAYHSDMSDIALRVYSGEIATPNSYRMQDVSETEYADEDDRDDEISGEGYAKSERDWDDTGAYIDGPREISQEEYVSELYSGDDSLYPHSAEEAVDMTSEKLDDIVKDRIGHGTDNDTANATDVYDELRSVMSEIKQGLKNAVDKGDAQPSELDTYEQFVKFVNNAYSYNGKVAKYQDFINAVRGVISHAMSIDDASRINKKAAALSGLNTLKFRTILNRLIKNSGYSKKYASNEDYKDTLRCILDEIIKYAPEVIDESDVDEISPSFMRTKLASKKRDIYNDVSKKVYNAKSKAGNLTPTKQAVYDSTFDAMFDDMADLYGRYATEAFANPTFHTSVDGGFNLHPVPEEVDFSNVGLSVKVDENIVKFLTFTMEGSSTDSEVVQRLISTLHNDVQLYDELNSYVNSLEQSKLKIDGIRELSDVESLKKRLESLVHNGYSRNHDKIIKTQTNAVKPTEYDLMQELNSVMFNGEIPKGTINPNNPFQNTPEMCLISAMETLASKYNSSVDYAGSGKSTINKEVRAQKYFDNKELNTVIDAYTEYKQKVALYNELSRQSSGNTLTDDQNATLSALQSELQEYRKFLESAAKSLADNMYNVLISTNTLLLTAVKYIEEMMRRGAYSMSGKMPVAGYDSITNKMTYNKEASSAGTARRESNMPAAIHRVMGLIKLSDKSSDSLDTVRRLIDDAVRSSKKGSGNGVNITDLMSSKGKVEPYKQMLYELDAFNQEMLKLFNAKDYSEIADGVTTDYASKLYDIPTHSRLMKLVDTICDDVRNVFMKNGKVDTRTVDAFASICNTGTIGHNVTGNDSIKQAILDICGSHDSTNNTLEDFIDDIYNTSIGDKDFKEKYSKKNIINENVISNSAETMSNVRQVVNILIYGTADSNYDNLEESVYKKMKIAAQLLFTTERFPESMKGLINYFKFRATGFKSTDEFDLSTARYNNVFRDVLLNLIEKDRAMLNSKGDTVALDNLNKVLAQGSNRYVLSRNDRAQLPPETAVPSYKSVTDDRRDIERVSISSDVKDTIGPMLTTLVDDWKKKFDAENKRKNGTLKWEDWLSAEVNRFYSQYGSDSFTEQEILDMAKQVKV